jgi:putative SOS response-associated peptidase YedK
VIWEEWEDIGLSFVMITVPANALISKVTDRMVAVLKPEDWPAWLGETDVQLHDVKALLKTFDDAGNWEMAPQEPSSAKTSRAKSKPQMDLF